MTLKKRCWLITEVCNCIKCVFVVQMRQYVSVQLKYSACDKQNSFHVSLIFILSEVRSGQPFHINVAIFWFFINITACYSTLGDNIEPTVSVRCLGVKGIIPAYLANKKQFKMAQNFRFSPPNFLSAK